MRANGGREGRWQAAPPKRSSDDVDRRRRGRGSAFARALRRPPLQPARPAPEPGRERVGAGRRAAPAPSRPDSQPRRDREGLRRPRALDLRRGDGGEIVGAEGDDARAARRGGERADGRARPPLRGCRGVSAAARDRELPAAPERPRRDGEQDRRRAAALQRRRAHVRHRARDRPDERRRGPVRLRGTTVLRDRGALPAGAAGRVRAALGAERLTAAVLIGAAVALWLLAVAIVYLRRRPNEPPPGKPTLDLGPAPPAVANLLVHDFRVTRDAVPATLLDLSARGLVELEEREPGSYVCRLETAPEEALQPYEQRVLELLRRRASGGIVPTGALTTGPSTESSKWW